MIAAVHRRAIDAACRTVVGALSSMPERSAETAADWSVAAFGGLDALLGKDVDVMRVCTPNATHARYASAVLGSGRHLVCEKPVATSATDAQHLADASGLVATVPFIYRYHPIIRELRARRITGEFGAWNALHGSWRVHAETGGRSRAFADIGSHWCDLVEFVSGERFAALTALTSVAVPQRPEGSAASFSTVAGSTPLCRSPGQRRRAPGRRRATQPALVQARRGGRLGRIRPRGPGNRLDRHNGWRNRDRTRDRPGLR